MSRGYNPPPKERRRRTLRQLAVPVIGYLLLRVARHFGATLEVLPVNGWLPLFESSGGTVLSSPTLFLDLLVILGYILMVIGILVLALKAVLTVHDFTELRPTHGIRRKRWW